MGKRTVIVQIEVNGGMIDAKNCNKCNETKPVTDFRKDKRSATGFTTYCKPCQYEMEKAAKAKNPEKYAETARRHYEQNKEYQRAYRRNRAERQRAQRQADMQARGITRMGRLDIVKVEVGGVLVNAKKCPGCGEVKPFTDYYKAKSKPTGLTPYCKSCHTETSSFSRRKRWGWREKISE